MHKFMKYKNHIGFPLTRFDSNKIKKKFNFLKNNINLVFTIIYQMKKLVKLPILKIGI